MRKRKAASAAAILSLALTTGACTAAFRLIDALLLRPLPIAAPERLHSVAFEGGGVDGKRNVYDSCSHPMFDRFRAAVHDQAESIAVSYAETVDLTYGSSQESEKAYRQFVSGWMFVDFGIRPAAGRLFTEDDDRVPGARAVAVLSHDYWARRFGRDPHVIGRTVRMGDTPFEIIGVAAAGFTGTETGTMTDLFLPMMMKNPRVLASTRNYWLRTLVHLKPGASPDVVREKLRSAFRVIQVENGQVAGTPLKPGAIPQNEVLLLQPSPAGRSNLQREYRQSLTILGVLVALVLVIACANIANLKMAQAAARTREMALRISIGASRRHLVQLVMVESACLAVVATALGTCFAWWAAPFIAGRIDSPDNPAHLTLSADWRTAAFSLLLAFVAALLFGAAPALRTSSVKPVFALKGGDDPHSRRRLMHGLIALQVAFCFVVLFVAGLFVATFERLSQAHLGFSAERVLNLETVTSQPQPAIYWTQVMEHLRTTAGVESAAVTIWPLMSGESRVTAISVGGAPPDMMLSDVLNIAPGWFETMRIPMLDGRDFRADDTAPNVAVVNQAFVRKYFGNRNPIGDFFHADAATVRIIGLVPDARSRDNVRLPIRPIAYFPFQSTAPSGGAQPASRGTIVIRTSGPNPLALAANLRQEVSRYRPDFRVSNVRTQTEIIASKIVRERMLNMLALFFSTVAILLAGVGLYGVLDYSVQQRRREIGIRMAIGARPGRIARQITGEVLAIVACGAVAGLGLGLFSARYVASLLFEVRAGDASRFALPAVTILGAALAAALPAIIRAVRIDPVNSLKAE